jgi:hypothetical protein
VEAEARRNLDFDNLSSAIRRSLHSKQPTTHDSTEMSHVVLLLLRSGVASRTAGRSCPLENVPPVAWLSLRSKCVAQNCTGPPVAQFLSCKKYFELSLAILFDFFYRGDMMRQLLGRACCLECDFGGENTFGSSVLGPVTVVAGEPARGSPEVRTARRKPLNSWPRELLPGASGYGWGALSAEAETISVSGPGVKSRCYANFVPGEPN